MSLWKDFDVSKRVVNEELRGEVLISNLVCILCCIVESVQTNGDHIGDYWTRNIQTLDFVTQYDVVNFANDHTINVSF